MWNDVRRREEHCSLEKPLKQDAGVYSSRDDAFPFPVEGRHTRMPLSWRGLSYRSRQHGKLGLASRSAKTGRQHGGQW